MTKNNFAHVTPPVAPHGKVGRWSRNCQSSAWWATCQFPNAMVSAGGGNSLLAGLMRKYDASNRNFASFYFEGNLTRSLAPR